MSKTLEEVRLMAKGACLAMNKLAYKDVGFRSQNLHSVAAEASDLPANAWGGYRVIFYFSEKKMFYYKVCTA